MFHNFDFRHFVSGSIVPVLNRIIIFCSTQEWKYKTICYNYEYKGNFEN